MNIIAEISNYVGQEYRVSSILTISRDGIHVDIGLSPADLAGGFDVLKERVIDPAIASLKLRLG